MTETTARIRWEPVEGGMDGHVGTAGAPPFTIHSANLSYADWMLTAELPGDAVPGSDREKLKAEAERWLERFISSLGAAFPEDAASKREDVLRRFAPPGPSRPVEPVPPHPEEER